MAFRCLGLVLLVFVVFVPPVEAGYKACLKLYRSQKYKPAASCFQALARQLGDVSSLTRSQRLTKGTALRGAAIALRKEAQRSRRAEVSSYLYAEAVRLLWIYEKEKLYPNVARRNSTRLLRLQLLQRIGAGPLSVATGTTSATLTIKGYKFAASGRGKWLGSVRPGRYVVAVRYVNGTNKTKTVFLAKGKAIFVSFSAPVPAARTKVPVPQKGPGSALRWVGGALLVVGGAVAVGSVAPFLLASGADSRMKNDGETYQATCAFAPGEQSNACADLGRRVRQAHADGGMYQVLALAMLVGGVVLAAVGAVLVALPAPKRASVAVGAVGVPVVAGASFSAEYE